MNVLFLTLSRISDIKERGIYTDLMREFVRHGHTMYIVVPAERRFHQPTEMLDGGNVKILRVWTFNIQKSNLIEKGIGTLLLEYQYQKAIQKYWKNAKFDLILYSTPPITFNKVIAALKKKGAKTYLLLKDIFPQNAVDLGMFSKDSFLYRMFRKKEERLYQLSDYIGCMSPANVDYVLMHNREVDTCRVEVCPNSIELCRGEERLCPNEALLQKLSIPIDKILFIYGGNLGRPQGIDFLIEVLAANEKRNDSFFIIVGNGTEFMKIKLWFDQNTPHNACLLSSLPKQEYDSLVRVCDIGLIFLDRRFTIPNFPSRLLSYLENRMPVLMATDKNTDIGEIAKINGFGLWTESGNIETYMEMVDFMAADRERIKIMGENGYPYLEANYTVNCSYDIIMEHFE
mgnify:FL=1